MNKKNRYPPTQWPDQWPDAELPTPRVVLRKFDLTDDGWLEPRRGTLELTEPPPELHLRELREVAADEPAALRDLCEVVGEVVRPGSPWVGVVGRGMHPDVAGRHAQRLADNVGDQLSLPAADWAARPLRGVHVREVALRVALVRLMVNHAELALADKRTAPLWQRAGFLDEDALSGHEEAWALAMGERPLSEEKPEVVAWARFAETINQGLSEFTPRIRALNIESEPDMSDLTTAYGAACAQIFNDLRAPRVPYRYCADQTCGRLFLRQLGRSKGLNKPRATGVEFCTWAHARNQSRRERRREQRERKD